MTPNLDRLHHLSVLHRSAAWIAEQRDNEIRHQYGENGIPAAELARITGLTRQRIHQIINEEGPR